MDEILKTIIAEAAGEGEEGMYAVASVIANRAKRRGKTPKEIVNQPKQFTGRWRKDLDAFVSAQPPEVIEAAQRAWQMAQENPITSADHYLTSELYNDKKRRPSWASKMGIVATIGGHTFLDSMQGEHSMLEPSQGDHIEKGIRRINRMAMDTGFGPLNMKEIEMILSRATPPTSINGVEPNPGAVPSALQPNMPGMIA